MFTEFFINISQNDFQAYVFEVVVSIDSNAKLGQRYLQTIIVSL